MASNHSTKNDLAAVAARLGSNVSRTQRRPHQVPGEIPGPLDPVAAMEFPNDKDDYEVTEADQQMMATGHGQLVGQFLLDR